MSNFRQFKPPVRGGAVSSNIRLLYVEDEDLNWDITQRALESTYTLVRARNAWEAFTALTTRGPFDLILMDVQLSDSDLDGVQITQILKGQFSGPIPSYAMGVVAPDTPIVFVTAYAALYKREDMLRVGGADLTTKPVNFTSLSLIISRILARNVMKK